MGSPSSGGAEHLNHAFKGEPFGNLLTTAKHLAELSAAEFLHVQATGFGMLRRHIALFLGVNEVQGLSLIHI